MTATDYAHRLDLLEKPRKVNGASRHLIDANCDYVDGAFRLSGLPPKLPILFTVRFTAPADFTPGDVFTLKGQEFAVKTRTMDDPEGKLFSAGAVAQCDIDMERELAFFTAGVGESGQSCGCRYQTGHLSFFIDPDGDDSLNNPGTVDSPFRTLAGARNAVCQRHIFTPMGSLFYNINPGTYELNADDNAAFCYADHPMNIYFQASDPNNKPLLVSTQFQTDRGRRYYVNLRLESTTDTYGVAANGTNAQLILRNIEVTTHVDNARSVHALHGGLIYLQQSLVLDGSGKAINWAIGCGNGEIWIPNRDPLLVTIKNMPSVQRFAYCEHSYFHLANTTFTGTTSGRRYQVVDNGVLYTGGGGANYFPGSTAGTVSNGGVYR